MTYKDVTILQFQQLHSATIHFQENRFELGVEILNIFEGIERKEIKDNWSVDKLNKSLEKYSFLDTELVEDTWVKEFECNGVHYKVSQSPNEWNVGQYVSMANLTRDKDKIVESLHVILAAMCCKESDNVSQVATDFQQHLSITIAYPIALFFCAVMLALPKDMLRYLKVGELQTGLQ